MDALSHNLEAYCSPVFHPMVQGIALEGVRLVKEWLPAACEDGTDLAARAHMQVASTMGATAFQKRLGAIGNDVVFGLAAGVWTENMRRAITMSERLQAGAVWVNMYRTVSYTMPFGGYKRSGLGRELGQQAVLEYMQTKSVWISTAEEMANPFVIG